MILEPPTLVHIMLINVHLTILMVSYYVVFSHSDDRNNINADAAAVFGLIQTTVGFWLGYCFRNWQHNGGFSDAA